MNTSFAVKALAGRRGEVKIYDEIGPSFWGDSVNAKTFSDDIAELDVDQLDVRINSPGGDIFDGITIMNALKRHPAKVTAYVDGLAASAASIIAVGGADEVVMCEGSQMMVHDAWSWGAGNATDLQRLVDRLDKSSDDMAKIYAKKAGTPVEEWREAMKEETWCTDEEAVALGLADRIDEHAEENIDDPVHAFRDAKIFAKFRYDSRGSAPAPRMMQRKKENPMAKIELQSDGVYTAAEIKKLLASVDTAEVVINDPDPVVEAVEDVEKGLAEARTAEKVEDQEAETPTTEESDDDTVVVNKAVWEETLRRAARGDEAAEEDKQERAVALIDGEGIKKGRLLGWQRDAWVAKAVENYDGTKASLQNLASGLIPLAEAGRGGSDEDRKNNQSVEDRQVDIQAAMDAHNLFPDK